MSQRVILTGEGVEFLEREIAARNKKLSQLRDDYARTDKARGNVSNCCAGEHFLSEEIERRRLELTALIERLQAAQVYVFTSENRPMEQVRIGAIVRIEKVQAVDGSTSECVLELAGYEESNLARGRIGYNCPLARAMLGLERGDGGLAITPGGPVEFTVLEFYRDWRNVPKVLLPEERRQQRARLKVAK